MDLYKLYNSLSYRYVSFSISSNLIFVMISDKLPNTLITYDYGFIFWLNTVHQLTIRGNIVRRSNPVNHYAVSC